MREYVRDLCIIVFKIRSLHPFSQYLVALALNCKTGLKHYVFLLQASDNSLLELGPIPPDRTCAELSQMLFQIFLLLF